MSERKRAATADVRCKRHGLVVRSAGSCVLCRSRLRHRRRRTRAAGAVAVLLALSVAGIWVSNHYASALRSDVVSRWIAHAPPSANAANSGARHHDQDDKGDEDDAWWSVRGRLR